MTFSAGALSVPAYAAETKAAASDNLVTQPLCTSFFDEVLEYIMNFFEMIFRRLYSNPECYQCCDCCPSDMEVSTFVWSGSPPVLETSGTSAFGLIMSLNTDINFWTPGAQFATWYEFSLDGGLTWSDILTSDATTFLRNNFWQGYICNAADSTVRFNNLGTNMYMPAETLVSFTVTGDASDRLASVYYLEAGTMYQVRLQLYASNGCECLNYTSPAATWTR